MKTENNITKAVSPKARFVVLPRLLSIEDAAWYLGISAKTIRNALCRNAKDPFPVKPKRHGKRILFDIKDLDAYIDSMPLV